MLLAARRSLAQFSARHMSTSRKTKAASAGAVAAPAKKAKADTPKEVLQSSPTPRKPLPEQSFKAISWNVAGLRALLANGNVAALQRLVSEEDPDALILSEHKLQEKHVAAAEAQLREALPPAYGAFYWSISTVKAGYSGVVTVLRGPAHSEIDGKVTAAAEGEGAPWGPAGAPLSVRYGLGQGGSLHVGEGRSVVIDFQRLTLHAVYVPNSGEGLKRIHYRLNEWERDMRLHVSAAAKPLLMGGDLNVAHLDADVYNSEAKHIKKQAGLTPQERAAFGQLLTECSLVDTFRAIHPEATHCYSYWSQRAGNQPYNRGLRLDYWLYKAQPADGEPTLHDGFICQAATEKVSDHAPVGVVLQL